MVIFMGKLRHTSMFILMIITVMYVMTGCGKVNASPSDMDTISVMKDGNIVQTIVDEFDRSLYSVDELSAMTKDKIDLYSEEDGDIVCESVEENDNMVIVKISYKTGEGYTDFNDKELYFGTVSDASSSGYSVKDMVMNNGTPLSDEQFKQIKDNHVLIVQTEAGEELGINVYDKIIYMSDNVTLSGKKAAVIGVGEEDRLSCIVFK
ncbi:MAG: hypothetical protein K2K46_14445 [Lachnospiraceae bacterium]|nr:hypothetical protein [Lachnospiraceae bacterium]